MRVFKFILLTALTLLSHVAISKDFSLTTPDSPDCISDSIIDKALTKKQLRDMFKSKSDRPEEFISDWSCSGEDEINIGIDGNQYLLKKYSNRAFGLPPLGYMSENGDVKVEIDQLEYILIDKSKTGAMEVDPGVYCYPTYRRVRVQIEFKGMTRTVLGTTMESCPG